MPVRERELKSHVMMQTAAKKHFLVPILLRVSVHSRLLTSHVSVLTLSTSQFL